jgi:hypothetical protein
MLFLRLNPLTMEKVDATVASLTIPRPTSSQRKPIIGGSRLFVHEIGMQQQSHHHHHGYQLKMVADKMYP